ncbi:MAG TPA: adenylyl-sulfate kinase, partial [Rubricoccaceae bacterium]
AVRARFASEDFAEALVTARPETLRARDPKGLYARAAAGEISDLTGVGAPYEAPDAPDLTLDTDVLALEAAVEAVLAHLAARGCVPA